jgi:hypothetical protein
MSDITWYEPITPSQLEIFIHIKLPPDIKRKIYKDYLGYTTNYEKNMKF